MKNLKLTSEELTTLRTCLSSRMDLLETDMHKNNHKHHLSELHELRELRERLGKLKLGKG